MRFSRLGERRRKEKEGEKGILRVLSSCFSAFLFVSRLGLACFVRGCFQLRVSGCVPVGLGWLRWWLRPGWAWLASLVVVSSCELVAAALELGA